MHRALIVVALLAAPGFAGFVRADCTGSDCICGADLDGDGTTSDPGEVADCTPAGETTQCPLQQQACTSSVDGWTCPSSPAAACVDTGDGQMTCSPNACVSRNSIVPVTDDPYQELPPNDGPRDAAGNCLGELRVFGGAGKRCRKAGTQTAYQNCCTNDEEPLDDTMGAVGEPSQPDYKKERSSFEFWKNQCDTVDQETALLADSDYCVALGSYCAESWPLVGCVQKAEGYCCFGSKLAKIIQVQGRAQLPSKGDFGSASHPDCRGFTMQEFQALDFSKIDLTEYYGNLRYSAQSTMQQMTQQQVRDGVPR